MRRLAGLLAVLLAVALTGGCVERKFVIETDPPNVLVLVNNQPLGPSPADGSFVYYGKYNFTLMAPGYETLHVQENVVAPWYEWIGLDFVFETLWPFELDDVHQYHYHMVPMQIPNTADVLRRSGEIRDQGRALRPAPTPPKDETAGVPPQAQLPPAEMPRRGGQVAACGVALAQPGLRERSAASGCLALIEMQAVQNRAEAVFPRLALRPGAFADEDQRVNAGRGTAATAKKCSKSSPFCSRSRTAWARAWPNSTARRRYPPWPPRARRPASPPGRASSRAARRTPALPSGRLRVALGRADEDATPRPTCARPGAGPGRVPAAAGRRRPCCRPSPTGPWCT